MLSSEQPLLSIQVEGGIAKKHGIFLYQKTTRMLFMPGAIYLFLLFFIFNLFTVERSDSFPRGIFMLSLLTTLFIEFIFWLVRKAGLVFLRKNIQAYTLDFYPEKIVRIKDSSNRMEYQRENIQAIQHFSDFDLVYYKEEGQFLRKEVIIPHEAMDTEYKTMYEEIMAAFE